jgi:hypothetical protein
MMHMYRDGETFPVNEIKTNVLYTLIAMSYLVRQVVTALSTRSCLTLPSRLILNVLFHSYYGISHEGGI